MVMGHIDVNGKVPLIEVLAVREAQEVKPQLRQGDDPKDAGNRSSVWEENTTIQSTR